MAEYIVWRILLLGFVFVLGFNVCSDIEYRKHKRNMRSRKESEAVKEKQ